MCTPDIFQEKMSTLMKVLEFTYTFVYDILCLSRGSFTENLSGVKQVLVRLHNVNLKVNTVKLRFGKTEIDNLGYISNRKCIKPQPKKYGGYHEHSSSNKH